MLMAGLSEIDQRNRSATSKSIREIDQRNRLVKSKLISEIDQRDDDDDDGGDDEEFSENFQFHWFRLIEIFFGSRSCSCDSIGPKIVETGVILAICSLFENLFAPRGIRKLTKIQIGSHSSKQ